MSSSGYEKMPPFPRLQDCRVQHPRVWLIDPSGNAVGLRISPNISNGVTYLMDGNVYIKPAAEKAGWKFMRPLCTEAEWATWMAWIEQSDKARVKRPGPGVLPKCVRPHNDVPEKAEFVPPVAEQPVPSPAEAAPPPPKPKMPVKRVSDGSEDAL